MARISGIQIEKDSKGRPAYARFNLKKHPEALALLQQIGAIEDDDFEKKWESSISGDQVRKALHTHLDKLFNER